MLGVDNDEQHESRAAKYGINMIVKCCICEHYINWRCGWLVWSTDFVLLRTLTWESGGRAQPWCTSVVNIHCGQWLWTQTWGAWACLSRCMSSCCNFNIKFVKTRHCKNFVHSSKAIESRVRLCLVLRENPLLSYLSSAARWLSLEVFFVSVNFVVSSMLLLVGRLSTKTQQPLNVIHLRLTTGNRYPIFQSTFTNTQVTLLDFRLPIDTRTAADLTRIWVFVLSYCTSGFKTPKIWATITFSDVFQILTFSNWEPLNARESCLLCDCNRQKR